MLRAEEPIQVVAPTPRVEPERAQVAPETVVGRVMALARAKAPAAVTVAMEAATEAAQAVVLVVEAQEQHLQMDLLVVLELLDKVMLVEQVYILAAFILAAVAAAVKVVLELMLKFLQSQALVVLE